MISQVTVYIVDEVMVLRMINRFTTTHYYIIQYNISHHKLYYASIVVVVVYSYSYIDIGYKINN